MASRPDLPRLSEAQICEICGCSPQRRAKWVKRKLLDPAARGGGGLRDALELAQLLRLIEVLGPTDAVVAWEQVRERLAQPFAAQILDVVFDTELKTAVVVDQAGDVREAVVLSHGRPVRLVELAPRRREITEAVRRIASALAANQPARQTARSRRRTSRGAPGGAG